MPMGPCTKLWFFSQKKLSIMLSNITDYDEETMFAQHEERYPSANIKINQSTGISQRQTNVTVWFKHNQK